MVDHELNRLVPGAMDSGVVNPLFWVTMPVALFVAYVAAYPVNRTLLQRQKGHALLMQHHDHGRHHGDHAMGVSPLSYGLGGFFIAGLLVSVVAS